MRTVASLGVLVFVVLVAFAPTAAAFATIGGTTAAPSPVRDVSPQHADNESNTTSPGQRLAGVVGVQKAEIEGEMEERTFGVKVARSQSNNSKAAVVATQLSAIEQRLAALEQRKQALEAAHENGTIGEGEYRARMAELAANASVSRRLANVSEDAARGLPTSVLARNGIDATTIQSLRDRLSNVTGPEVAAIARSIAGPGVGQGIAGDNRPGHAGPPGGIPGGGGGNDTESGGGGPPGGIPGGGGGNDTEGGGGNDTEGGGPPPGVPGGGGGNDTEGGGPPPGVPGGGGGNDTEGGGGNDTEGGGPPPGVPGGGNDNESGDAGNAGNATDDSGNESDAGNAGNATDDSGNAGDAGNAGKAMDGNGTDDGADTDGGSASLHADTVTIR